MTKRVGDIEFSGKRDENGYMIYLFTMPGVVGFHRVLERGAGDYVSVPNVNASHINRQLREAGWQKPVGSSWQTPTGSRNHFAMNKLAPITVAAIGKLPVGSTIYGLEEDGITRAVYFVKAGDGWRDSDRIKVAANRVVAIVKQRAGWPSGQLYVGGEGGRGSRAAKAKACACGTAVKKSSPGGSRSAVAEPKWPVVVLGTQASGESPLQGQIGLWMQANQQKLEDQQMPYVGRSVFVLEYTPKGVRFHGFRKVAAFKQEGFGVRISVNIAGRRRKAIDYFPMYRLPNGKLIKIQAMVLVDPD